MSVVVYPDGARITRRGRVAVVQGPTHVRGLPLLLDEGSVDARVAGGAVHRVQLGLDLEGVDRVGDPERHRRWVEAETALARLEAERQVLDSTRSAVTAWAPPTPGETRRDAAAPAPGAFSRWREVEAALDPWLTELDRRRSELVEAIPRARDVRDARRSELDAESNQARWRRWLPTRTATIDLAAEAGAELVISYRIAGALWAPSYAVFADRGLTKARLALRAVVAQATGEDWSHVRLSVSSARSQRSIDIPELRSLRLGSVQPPAKSPWRELPAGLDALFPADLPQIAPAPAPAGPSEFGDDLGVLSDEDEVTMEQQTEVAAPPPPVPRSAPVMPSAAMPVAGGPPMQAMAPKRGGVLSGLAGALSAATTRNAPPPAGFVAPAALPAPAPQSFAPASAPPETDVARDALDYPHLRMQAWHAAPGARGKLRPSSLSEEAVAAGLPADGAERLVACLQAAARRIASVSSMRLPSQHVLPAALDGVDVRIDAAEGVDVASDGHLHGVPLVEENLALAVRYRTVARLDPRVFRTLVATRVEVRPLLPGPVDFFVDGALVLSIAFGGSPRGGEVELPFGVETALKVARNVRYREESAGLLGGNRRLHTEIETEIASALPTGIVVDVLDRVPIAGEDGIDVAENAASPDARPWKGDPDGPQLEGGRIQRLRVDAGATAKAVMSWSITLSAKHELVEGDRRG